MLYYYMHVRFVMTDKIKRIHTQQTAAVQHLNVCRVHLIGSGNHSDEVWCFDGFVLLLPLTIQQLTVQ